MTSEEIKCPYCNKPMKISKVPYLDKELMRVRCKDCHILITTETLANVEWVIKCFYRGQWDFEVKYINGELMYSRIGGGHRISPTKEE